MSDNTQRRVHPDCELRIDVSRTIFFGSAPGPPSLFELRRGSHRFRLALRAAAGVTPAQAGGARRDRTDDLMLAKHALSQLSYGPVTRRRMLHADRQAIWSPSHLVAELFGSKRKRTQSNWWAWEDLNFRPHAYQARALTN